VAPSSIKSYNAKLARQTLIWLTLISIKFSSQLDSDEITFPLLMPNVQPLQVKKNIKKILFNFCEMK